MTKKGSGNLVLNQKKDYVYILRLDSVQQAISFFSRCTSSKDGPARVAVASFQECIIKHLA